MSVFVMSQVWERSQHGGSALLMLLAIADFADDQGRAFPAVATLARKCRVKPRAANYTLRELQDSGELVVRIGGGPPGPHGPTNLYRVVLKDLGVQLGAGVQGTAGVQGKAARGAKDCAKPLQSIADKPPLNHQEPPSRPKLPFCPHQAIVDLYHHALPELPRALVMGKKRQADLKAFWQWVLTSNKSDGARRAETAEQALDWIKAYFERARGNDFLMGRTARGEGHGNWKCDLDFLLTEKGKRQVIEKTEASA